MFGSARKDGRSLRETAVVALRARLIEPLDQFDRTAVPVGQNGNSRTRFEARYFKPILFIDNKHCRAQLPHKTANLIVYVADTTTCRALQWDRNYDSFA